MNNLASIYEWSTEDDSDDVSISINSIKDIWDGNYVHPDINACNSGLKILDCIIQAQIEQNRAELSAKRMGKGFHQLFKAVVNELNNSLPNLVESG